jgi:gliding motility-associated-like protein
MNKQYLPKIFLGTLSIRLTIFLLIVFLVNINYAENKTMAKSSSYSLTTPHDSLVVIVPNVFTPNGDGVNDTWSIGVYDYGIVVLELEATVYDRWGKQIFHTTNIHQVWSGYNLIGKPCEDGTYFYLLTYMNSATHNTEIHKGFIELLR